MSDSSLQATATRLINKKGRPIQILRTVTMTPADPGMPWKGPAASSLVTNTKGVWLDPLRGTKLYHFADKEDPDTTALVSDWDVMFPAEGLTFTPMQGDIIKDVGRNKTFRIVTLSPMEPGLTNFFITAQVHE